MTNNKEDMRLNFRPTIIVGLGGTGVTVLSYLKALLLDTIGEEVFEAVRLLAIDTDDALREVRRRDGSLVSLSVGREFIHLGFVPTTSIMENLERHEEIAAWLPQDLPPQTITQGARMVRLLGRLALFYHFSKVTDPLQAEINDLRNIYSVDQSIGERGRIVETPVMNAFVVSSVCGGTGAGMFIDVAYLIRHYCREVGLDPEFVFLTGVLVLPSAFTKVKAHTRLAANAKACLDDLDDLMTRASFDELYPGATRVVFPRTRPFDVCYLVDAVNRNSYTLEGLDQLAPVLATAIFLQIASQVGEANKSRFDNILSTTEWFHGAPTAYSGLGCATIVFPARQLIESCARRLAVEFLRGKVLHSSAGEAAVEHMLQDFMNGNNITADRLLSEVLQRPGQRRFSVELSVRELEGVSINQVAERAQRMVQRMEARLDGQGRELMLANLGQLQEELVNALRSRVVDWVNDPSYGLGVTLRFLEWLDDELRELSEMLTERRAELDHALQREQRNCERALDALGQAVTSRLPFWRNIQVGRARDDFVRSHDRRLRLRLSLQQHDLVLRLLATLRTSAIEQRRLYADLRDRLTRIVHDLSVSRGDGLGPREEEVGPLTWPVVGIEDLPRFYDHYVPGDEQWMSRAVEVCGPVSVWTSLSYRELEASLLEFARQPFEPISSIEIESIIGDNAESIDAWLRKLRSNSVPFWNWAPGKVGSLKDRLDEIRVLGVARQDQSVFLGREHTGEELISIGDYHTVTMLSTEHGLPTNALRQYEEYQRHYERHYATARSGGRMIPLRLFDFAAQADVVRREARALEAFATGETFGYIVADGSHTFYFQIPEEPPREGWRRVGKLGQGLQNAVKGLGERPEYMEEIEKRVEEYREEYGRRAVEEKVNEYLRRPRRGGDELQELHEKLDAAIKGWAGLT